MTKKPILRVDPETHRQILERARDNIKAAKEWAEQIQVAIDECDRLYEATPIAQYRTCKRAAMGFLHSLESGLAFQLAPYSSIPVLLKIENYLLRGI
jgi:hypothetical protein